MAKLKIAISTTPRANKTDTISEWIDWARDHFACLSGCSTKLVAAMPTRPSAEVEKALDILLPGDDKNWDAMVPGFIGAGDTFRGACFFAFANDLTVDYVLHVPIDVDFGNPHEDDVQGSVKQLLDPILKPPEDSRPDLVIGDYVPMVWDESNKTGRPSPFETSLENHVKEQLRHYFPGNIVERLAIVTPRSEFFAIGRRLFEKVNADRRFWPWDPIPQILIFAERNDFRVEKTLLGRFYEPPKFASGSIRDQVWRTAFQISSDWLRYQHTSGLKPSDVRTLLPTWKVKISEGMDLAFNRLEQMLNDPNVT